VPTAGRRRPAAAGRCASPRDRQAFGTRVGEPDQLSQQPHELALLALVEPLHDQRLRALHRGPGLRQQLAAGVGEVQVLAPTVLGGRHAHHPALRLEPVQGRAAGGGVERDRVDQMGQRHVALGVQRLQDRELHRRQVALGQHLGEGGHRVLVCAADQVAGQLGEPRRGGGAAGGHARLFRLRSNPDALRMQMFSIHINSPRLHGSALHRSRPWLPALPPSSSPVAASAA
jgi:hypothetical protein